MLLCVFSCWGFFFFKQKTAYEMRISDWSSDVCSSDLEELLPDDALVLLAPRFTRWMRAGKVRFGKASTVKVADCPAFTCPTSASSMLTSSFIRSEEHTSELQSLMRISYAVFCLKKKNNINKTHSTHDYTYHTPKQ